MAGPGKQYVVGKGKVYFDKFTPGTKTATGERYLGNSPELTVSQASETLDHIDADAGLNVKDEQITISNDMTGTIALDSIEVDNVALWFGGDIERTVIAAATEIVEPDFIAKRGTWVHLGKTADNPAGTRKVVNVTVAVITPPVAPATDPTVTLIDAADLEDNVEINLETGRIYIEPGAPLITNGTMLRVTYDQEALQTEIVISRGQEIRGSMRMISDNPVGDNKDFYWPYVKLTANGDFALKSDTWQQMSFNYEVLKRDDSTERLYIDNRPTASAVV